MQITDSAKTAKKLEGDKTFANIYYHFHTNTAKSANSSAPVITTVKTQSTNNLKADIHGYMLGHDNSDLWTSKPHTQSIIYSNTFIMMIKNLDF